MRAITLFLLLSLISTTLFSQEASPLKLYVPEENLYNSYGLQSSTDDKEMILFNGESATLVLNDEPEGSGHYTLNDGTLNFTIEKDNDKKVFNGKVFQDSLVLSITTYKDNRIVDEILERTYILNSDDHITTNEIEIPDEVVIEEEEPIFRIAEIGAVPPGDYAGLYQFIAERFVYPDSAIKDSIQGTVYLQFIVEKDGSLSNVKVLKGIGAGCNEECVRVIKESPAWTPAFQRGVPVRQQIVLPIKLELHQMEMAEEKLNRKFIMVDQPATPKGGYGALYQFISEKLVYPKKAVEQGIEGTVYVQFVVEKDGSISSVEAIRGIGSGCDEEAERVVKEFPTWIPARHNEEPMFQRIVIPIKFQLESSKKKEAKEKGQGLDEINKKEVLFI